MLGNLPLSLWLKAVIVRSPLEGLAKSARKLCDLPAAMRHPELWEIRLEEGRIQQVLKRLLKPDSNVIDVGCHIGSFISLVLKFSPRGRHIAVEASPSKAAWLTRKFPEVEVASCAAGDANGEVLFEDNPARPGYSKIVQAAGALPAYRVPMRRLDDIVTDGRHIDFLKLDVEGSELLCLRGAIELLNRSRPNILFECGSEYAIADYSRRQLFDFLEGSNYQVFTLGDLLFDKSALGFDEFKRCGLYPFRAFNFIATPLSIPI